jgi:hypothetical protein
MATKNGLVESLVMRTTPTAASPPPPVSVDDPRLQAASENAAAVAVNTATPDRREGCPDRRALEVVTRWNIAGSPFAASLPIGDNVVRSLV